MAHFAGAIGNGDEAMKTRKFRQNDNYCRRRRTEHRGRETVTETVGGRKRRRKPKRNARATGFFFSLLNRVETRTRVRTSRSTADAAGFDLDDRYRFSNDFRKKRTPVDGRATTFGAADSTGTRDRVRVCANARGSYGFVLLLLLLFCAYAPSGSLAVPSN